MQEALCAFGALPQGSIANLLLKSRRQQEGNPFTVGDTAQARGQPARPTTTSSVWQVPGIPRQREVVYTSIAASSVWKGCSTQRFFFLKPNLNIISTYPLEPPHSFQAGPAHEIGESVQRSTTCGYFPISLGKWENLAFFLNFNGSRWTLSASFWTCLRWLCVLRAGRWFTWAFTAPEPPEGWPPSPAQGGEGLTSEKSLLGPQTLRQMVPLWCCQLKPHQMLLGTPISSSFPVPQKVSRRFLAFPSSCLRSTTPLASFSLLLLEIAPSFPTGACLGAACTVWNVSDLHLLTFTFLTIMVPIEGRVLFLFCIYLWHPDPGRAKF